MDPLDKSKATSALNFETLEIFPCWHVNWCANRFFRLLSGSTYSGPYALVPPCVNTRKTALIWSGSDQLSEPLPVQNSVIKVCCCFLPFLSCLASKKACFADLKCGKALLTSHPTPRLSKGPNNLAKSTAFGTIRLSIISHSSCSPNASSIPSPAASSSRSPVYCIESQASLIEASHGHFASSSEAEKIKQVRLKFWRMR